MEHIRSVLDQQRGDAIPAGLPPPRIAWRAAAEEAHALARIAARDPATLRQLRRVCQLLTSHTVREDERPRALLRLARGCSRHQASAMLDYLIPNVRTRTAREQRAESRRSIRREGQRSQGDGPFGI